MSSAMSIDIDETELDAGGRVCRDGEPYSGEVVRRAPDGQVIALTTYLQGFEDGMSLEWFADGRRRVVGRSRYGVGAVGVWRVWHRCGALAAEYGFSDTGRPQFVRRWDPSGAVIENTIY